MQMVRNNMSGATVVPLQRQARASVRLVSTPADVALPGPGDRAPDFTLEADDGSQVRLADLRGQRVVLYAYPGAFTPGCTTQACDFRDNIASLQGAGITVLGLSPDPVRKLADFRAAEALPFRLLSDPEHEVLTTYGAFGEKQNYGRTYQGVIRSTFVIDADGVLEMAMRNVKAKGHVARLRAELGLD